MRMALSSVMRGGKSIGDGVRVKAKAIAKNKRTNAVFGF
jgi:hypothetical protein